MAAIRPEWQGLLNPNSRSMLDETGAPRHAFVDRVDAFQKAGFPNIAYSRHALTDPLLLNEPMYTSCLAIGKMEPGAGLVKNALFPHKTYNTSIAGDYFGALEKSVPKEVMYPQWYKERRAIGAPIGGDVRSFQLSNAIQPANQEWLDGVMNFLNQPK